MLATGSSLKNTPVSTTATRESRLVRLYSDHWMKRLRSYVARRYQDFGDWEGWFEEAHQNLALKIDAMPEEQEVSDALVFAVFKNELISVKRNRLGYPRPRAWLREFSELGQDLFEWMCLQKLSRSQIISQAEKKWANKAYSDLERKQSDRNSDDHTQLLVTLTDTMIEKKECDGTRPTTTDIDDESVGQIAIEAPSVEESADHAQLELMLSIMLGADSVTDDVRASAAERIAGMRASLQSEPLLDDMDILILRSYYFQGLSQNEVAKMVKQPLQRVVRKREAAIKRIGQFMEDHGLTRESFAL